MDNPEKLYTQASIATADNLKSIAESSSTLGLSHLSLPEVEAVINQVAKMIPAGNVPGMILSGLVRLTGGRKVSQKTVKRDVNLLFKGVAQTLDAAVYGTFFAGPAAVIWGYQQLLRLSGKKPEDAFPEGVWQFYVEYAMREDTARHTNETHGFDTRLKENQIVLNQIDRMSAWVMAAVQIIHQYDALLTNEWRERVCTSTLVEMTQEQPDADIYASLYRQWEKQRPYGRGADAEPDETYPKYRRRLFDQFLFEATIPLDADLKKAWLTRLRQAETEDLLEYRRQMSILAYLDPGTYGETRIPISLENAQIGVIKEGNYYLIPVCVLGTNQAVDLATVRAAVTALLAVESNQSSPLIPFAQIKRAAWPELRKKLSDSFVSALDKLRTTPILLNFDSPSDLSLLSEVRQAERGVGDHALTLFNTGTSMIFDLSHIFFDGAWGSALSEIMTQEAQYWASQFNPLTDTDPTQPNQVSVLTYNTTSADLTLQQEIPCVTPEVSAQSERIDFLAISKLRRSFKKRNDLLQVTVNDLLILYRAVHAVTYQPDPTLITELEMLSQAKDLQIQEAASTTLATLEESQKLNHTIAIPVDGSWRSPRERLYPVTVDVPLVDLDLLNLHQQTMEALTAYEQGQDTSEFKELQAHYLATLAGFGLVLSKAKEHASMGQSFSVGTIKLLAHMPMSLQKMLEKVPDNFDMLNDIIRGREVFSNVGLVAPNSTLTRFISAKDDTDKKTLVWGVLTDADGIMRLTLRDFRPHVAQLMQVGYKNLAARLTHHYLDVYTQGLNSFVSDLYAITKGSNKVQNGD